MKLKTIILNELDRAVSTTNMLLIGVYLLLFGLGLLPIMFSAGAQMGPDSPESAFAHYFYESGLGQCSFLIPLIIILNIGSEFKHGVVRKQLIDNYTRNEYFISKIVLVGLVAMFFTVLNYLIFLLTVVFTESLRFVEAISAYHPEFLLTTLVSSLLFGSLALTFIFLIRKTIFAAIGFIIYGILEQTSYAIYNNLDLPWLYPSKYFPKTVFSELKVIAEMDGLKTGLIIAYLLILLSGTWYHFKKTTVI